MPRFVEKPYIPLNHIDNISDKMKLWQSEVIMSQPGFELFQTSITLNVGLATQNSSKARLPS